MKLIYNNNYGTIYKVTNHPNARYTMQLVINNVGLFMSSGELKSLLKLVRSSYGLSESCNCKKCKGVKLNELWKSNKLIDICLKVDDAILECLEDLIVGTHFMLNIDAVLDEHRIN